MGKLEYEYRNTLFLPLPREVEVIAAHPGYRYIFFQTFRELNEFFSKECGPDWKNQEWAQYWLNQHTQTKNEDRLEEKLMRGEKVNGFDFEFVRSVIVQNYVMNGNQFGSIRKLPQILRNLGHYVSRDSIRKIIKHLKNNPEVLQEFIQEFLGEPLPPNECRYAIVRRFFYIKNLYDLASSDEAKNRLYYKLEVAQKNLDTWCLQNKDKLDVEYIINKERNLCATIQN